MNLKVYVAATALSKKVWLTANAYLKKNTVPLKKADECKGPREIMTLPFKIYGCKCSSEAAISLI